MGATTIWERWDSMLPDGTINPGEMTSFNHYALGAVADWLHRVVAGLAPAAPGYARIRIEPQPLTGFDFAEARHLTPYGPASVRWDRDGDQVQVVAEVPPNSRGRGGAAGRAAAGGRLGSAHLDGDRPGHGHLPAAGLAGDDPGRPDRRPRGVRGDHGGCRRSRRRSAADDVRRHTAWLPGRQVKELFDNRVPPAARELVVAAFEELNASRPD